MPSRPVFKSADLPVEMAKHFIRVYREPPLDPGPFK